MRFLRETKRLPVALVTGCLGSGKTTLVNALLGDPAMANTAVAVNEFGDIPLDGQLLDHSTVTLANGCLCCNLAGDMEDAVMRIFARREQGSLPSFARLLIEPSGLADPAPIAQAILRNPMMAPVLRLEAIVTTLDAIFAETQLTRYPEAEKQVKLADRIVITKADLAGPEKVARLRDLARALNPVAPIQVAVSGAVSATSLFPPGFFDATAPAPPRSLLFADAGVPDHLGQVAAVRLAASTPLPWPALERWLRGIRLTHADDLLRLKALVQLRDTPGPVLLQGVHHVLHDPIELAAWEGPECSRLLLIVNKTIAAEIEKNWREFAAQEGFADACH